jgi:predicted nucleic acid-binding Zn ribbon protein
MIRKNTQSLRDVLKQVVKDQNLENKLYETRVINAFPEVVGRGISAHTKNLYVKDEVLYVQIDSSVVRNELRLMRQSLISRLNENLGKNVIKDIIFR